MHILLIRHGETEHNVAGLLAGVTDSSLTNHGVLQTERLARFLVDKQHLNFSQVFSSDLQRAFRTANEICKAHNARSTGHRLQVVQNALLQEQDFGSMELMPWNSKNPAVKRPDATDPGFKPKETKEAMTKRADEFLVDILLPLLALDDEEEQIIAIVSHGLFLGALWRALLARIPSGAVTISPEATAELTGRPLDHIGAWSNTGYLELKLNNSPALAVASTDLCQNPADTLETSRHSPGEQADVYGIIPSPKPPASTPNLHATMRILQVNARTHLQSLKRTRGVGSSTADDKQSKLEVFFKKPRA